MKSVDQPLPSLEDLPEHCTIGEIQHLFPVHRSTLYRLAERGELPNLRFGKTILIPKKDLLEWMEREKQRRSAHAYS